MPRRSERPELKLDESQRMKPLRIRSRRYTKERTVIVSGIFSKSVHLSHV